MPALGLQRHRPDPNAQLPAKRTRIPPKIAEAVRLLVTGSVRTQRAAAERVKMSPTYLCEALAKPKIRAYITQEVRKTLSAGQLRAAPKIIELLDSDSSRTALEATKYVLALEGISPPSHPQIVNNLNILPGYEVVLPGRRFSAIDGQFVKVEEPDREDAD